MGIGACTRIAGRLCIWQSSFFALSGWAHVAINLKKERRGPLAPKVRRGRKGRSVLRALREVPAPKVSLGRQDQPAKKESPGLPAPAARKASQDSSGLPDPLRINGRLGPYSE